MFKKTLTKLLKGKKAAIPYDEYAATCFKALTQKQASLRDDYGIGNYDAWYYDQVTGLLSFTKGDEKLYFKYFDVGTFSDNTNTWMWSWANKSTTSKVKQPCMVVKAYGEAQQYKPLIDEHFECEEADAWEYAAIANFITNGLGVYRPVSDHLKIFMVLTEVVDAETAEAMKNKSVDCDVHHIQRAAFVCQHLNKDVVVGFEEAFETSEFMELDDDDDFQAWCSECEAVRQREGEWNETSMAFANIKLVCETCYFDMKEVNLGYR